MVQTFLLDIPPDPSGTGALTAVVLLVIALVALVAGGLVLFLWYRKRSMRGRVMIHHEPLPDLGASQPQLSNPNQA
jgi:hypothetical protein